MLMFNYVVAPPALRRFMTARAVGAPLDELKMLADLALNEQERLRAERATGANVPVAKTQAPGPSLRLVFDNQQDTATPLVDDHG